MGASCSCVSKGRQFEVYLTKAVKTKESIARSVAEMDVKPEVVRTDLLKYLISNQKEMQPKLQVLFQKAISFPKEGLSAFDLDRCSLKDSDWAHFSTLILYGQQATSLHITQVLLTLSGLDFVCSYLELLRKLQDLSLSGSGLGCYPLQSLAAAIKHLRRLRKLDLSENELNSEHMEIIAPGLPSSLQECEFSHNEIEDRGCAVLAPFLADLAALRVLGLCENAVSETGKLLLQVGAKNEALQIWTEGPRPSDIRKEMNAQ